MRRLGQLFVFGILTMTFTFLSNSTAQEKKDEAKTEEKTEKPPEKKSAAKEAKEILSFGYVVQGRISNWSEETGKYTIDVLSPDPQKIFQLKIWQAQQMQGIAAAQSPQQRFQLTQQFQQEMMKKMQDPNATMSSTPLDIRQSENLRVRTIVQPAPSFDGMGKLIPLTPQKLREMQEQKLILPDAPKVALYQAGREDLRSGLIVKVYFAKTAAQAKAGPMAKGAPMPMPKKKKLDDDDDAMDNPSPEAVFILILQP